MSGSLTSSEALGSPDPFDSRWHRPVEGLRVAFVLDNATLEAVAERVAELLEERRDDGFLNVDSAAEFLSTTRKAVYHLVERRRIRAHRLGGRLLFDPAELRDDVERGE